MKNTKKFFVVVTSLMLVFAMIGCDTGTSTVTKEVPVAGPPGSSVPTYRDGYLVTQSGEVVEAFLRDELDYNADLKGLYVTANVEIDGNFTLDNGKTIVVTNGGPPTTPNTLTLKNAGVLFAATPDSRVTLTVKGQLRVQGNVVLGDTAGTSNSGVLKIVGSRGSLLVERGATIAVNTVSNVIADETSTVTFLSGSKVAAVGIANEEARTVFGITEQTALVVIPTANTRSSVEKADVYSDAAANVPVSDQKKGSINSTAKVAESANEVTFDNTTTTVTYSGTGSLPANTSVPSTGTLIVTGDLNQTAELKVSGTLEVAPGAEVTVSGASGKLTVEADAAVAIPEGATLAVSGGATLEIADGATFTNEGTISFGTTGTITGTGTIDNQGTIKTANAEVLAALLDDDKVTNGTVEVSGNVALSSESDEITVAVPKDVSLNIPDSAELKVGENVTLDLTALLAEDDEGESGALNGVVTINGTIEVASGGTFKAPAPSEAEEVVYGANGNVQLNAGSSAYIGTTPYIGAADTLLTWTDTEPNGGYVIIDNDGITLGGGGKLSKLTGPFQATGKVTIEAESVLTIGPTEGTVPDASFKLGNADGESSAELILKGTLELNTTGYLSVYSNGKLTVATTGKIKHTGTGKVNFRVHTGLWTPTLATTTGSSGTDWTVTTATSEGVALDITLGTVNITSEAENTVSVDLANADSAAAGSLTAGADTQILFLGVAAAE
jgi:hypothetical protein